MQKIKEINNFIYKPTGRSNHVYVIHIIISSSVNTYVRVFYTIIDYKPLYLIFFVNIELQDCIYYLFIITVMRYYYTGIISSTTQKDSHLKPGQVH